MKKLIGLVMVFVMAAFTMSGCGPKKVSNEITMWLVGAEAQAKTLNQLAEKFFTETGIKVRCQAISWGEAHSKYLTAIAGGVAPDIGTMGLTWAAEFGELGAMMDLKKEFPEDIDVFSKNIFAGIWESVQYRDKIYGIPFDMTIHLLYYRNDIIPQPPTTWSELTALLTELRQEDKGMIFDWGSMEWVGFSPFMWQAGGDYFNADYTASTIASPEAVTGMKFFTDLYKMYNVPKTRIPLEQGMRTGDFPICISGNWKIIGLTVGAPEIMGKWSIAKLPAGPTGKSTAFIGGRSMGIFSQSKNKEKAWEFIKFISNPESQTFLYKSSLETQDAYLPPNTESWSVLDMNPEFKRVLISQALDSKGPPPVLGWDSMTRFIDGAIQKIVLKNEDIQKDLNDVQSQLDAEISKNQN